MQSAAGYELAGGAFFAAKTPGRDAECCVSDLYARPFKNADIRLRDAKYCSTKDLTR